MGSRSDGSTSRKRNVHLVYSRAALATYQMWAALMIGWRSSIPVSLLYYLLVMFLRHLFALPDSEVLLYSDGKLRPRGATFRSAQPTDQVESRMKMIWH